MLFSFRLNTIHTYSMRNPCCPFSTFYSILTIITQKSIVSKTVSIHSKWLEIFSTKQGKKIAYGARIWPKKQPKNGIKSDPIKQSAQFPIVICDQIQLQSFDTWQLSYQTPIKNFEKFQPQKCDTQFSDFLALY